MCFSSFLLLQKIAGYQKTNPATHKFGRGISADFKLFYINS